MTACIQLLWTVLRRQSTSFTPLRVSRLLVDHQAQYYCGLFFLAFGKLIMSLAQITYSNKQVKGSFCETQNARKTSYWQWAAVFLRLVSGFLKNMGFQTSSSKYPQSNGKAENTVRIAKGIMKKAKSNGDDVWMAVQLWRNTEGFSSSPSSVYLDEEQILERFQWIEGSWCHASRKRQQKSLGRQRKSKRSITISMLMTWQNWDMKTRYTQRSTLGAIEVPLSNKPDHENTW